MNPPYCGAESLADVAVSDALTGASLLVARGISWLATPLPAADAGKTHWAEAPKYVLQYVASVAPVGSVALRSGSGNSGSGIGAWSTVPAVAV